jgi:hypothetical protein
MQKGQSYDLYLSKDIDLNIKISFQKTLITIKFIQLNISVEEEYEEKQLIEDIKEFEVTEVEQVEKNRKNPTVLTILSEVLEKGNHNMIFSNYWNAESTSFTGQLAIKSTRKEDKLTLNLVNIYKGGISEYLKGTIQKRS